MLLANSQVEICWYIPEMIPDVHEFDYCILVNFVPGNRSRLLNTFV